MSESIKKRSRNNHNYLVLKAYIDCDDVDISQYFKELNLTVSFVNDFSSDDEFFKLFTQLISRYPRRFICRFIDLIKENRFTEAQPINKLLLDLVYARNNYCLEFMFNHIHTVKDLYTFKRISRRKSMINGMYLLTTKNTINDSYFVNFRKDGMEMFNLYALAMMIKVGSLTWESIHNHVSNGIIDQIPNMFKTFLPFMIKYCSSPATMQIFIHYGNLSQLGTLEIVENTTSIQLEKDSTYFRLGENYRQDMQSLHEYRIVMQEKIGSFLPNEIHIRLIKELKILYLQDERNWIQERQNKIDFISKLSDTELLHNCFKHGTAFKSDERKYNVVNGKLNSYVFLQHLLGLPLYRMPLKERKQYDPYGEVWYLSIGNSLSNYWAPETIDAVFEKLSGHFDLYDISPLEFLLMKNSSRTQTELKACIIGKCFKYMPTILKNPIRTLNNLNIFNSFHYKYSTDLDMLMKIDYWREIFQDGKSLEYEVPLELNAHSLPKNIN